VVIERLWYEAGNEHNPTDPFGRITLDLSADGSVRIDHYGRAGHRSWTATVDQSVVDELTAALVQAGFPAAPAVLPMPGDRLRTLRVTGDPAGEVRLPWDVSALPGYADAFGILDALPVRPD
jgi:hypothetical protein